MQVFPASSVVELCGAAVLRTAEVGCENLWLFCVSLLQPLRTWFQRSATLGVHVT